MTDALCHRCGDQWDSLKWCHCATCCETFSSERYFDAHRSDFACLEPGSAKTRNGSKLLHPSSSKRTALGKVVWGGKPMESPENRRVVEK